MASTLCKYDLRKGDLFVLSLARVRQGSISSEMPMCGGSARGILLLPLVARCLETIDFEVQIALIFFRVWSEQRASCFVLI